MLRSPFILILAMTAALAQRPPQKGAAVPEKAAAKVVAPSEPVITIQGLCANRAPGKQTAQASACKTIITKQNFEHFLEVLGTTTHDIGPGSHRAIAEAYTSLLIGSGLAQRAGEDKDPRFEQILEGARMTVLSQMYRVKKIDEALQVPAEQIEAYYQKNIAGYDEVSLDRFLLPKNNPANLSDLEFRAKAKQLADELHARAVKGEDIYKLEKEGLERLGLKEDPAIVPVAVRRGQFDEKEDKELFALAQGGVTSVWDIPGLWTFYKRTSRRTIPLDIVGSEIKTKLFRDRLDALEKSLHDAVHVDYNEAYFGPPPGAPNPASAVASAKETQDGKPAGASTGGDGVAPSDAVMTIHGLCGSHKLDSPSGSCTLAITREQFETLMKIKRLAAANRVQSSPRDFAQTHLDLLIYGEAAEREGVEKDPRFPDVMKLARMRALNEMYVLRNDEAARNVSPEDIKAYYEKNIAEFEEINLLHVSVPRNKPARSKEADFDAKAKKLAAEIRERAAKGEDMDKLQKEVYETLGLKDPQPALMRPVRRDALDQHTVQEVLALKPGEVTNVEEFPPAYVIYKLVGRRMVPLEEAKTEISQTLYQKNLQRLTKLARVIRAEYNERFFAPSSAGGPAPAGNNAVASHKANSRK